MKFRIIAIATDVVNHVRSSGTSPRYGHLTQTQVATGYGPCRHCLRTFRVGEESRILFTYDAFTGIEPIPLPGPVFIHEQPCARYGEVDGYPADMTPYPVILSAYASGQTLLDKLLLAPQEDKHHAIELMLSKPEVDYIEVRDQTAGCFDFRIERAQQQEESSQTMTNEDVLWLSIQERDRSKDGTFFYGVLTTGVYCKPSCSSRQPLRRNVRFYPTVQQAERDGLRPCLRCKPGAAPSVDVSIEGFARYATTSGTIRIPTRVSPTWRSVSA